MIDPRRIRRAIRKSTAAARLAIATARQARSLGLADGGAWEARVALETVAYHRSLNRERRAALRAGRLV